MSSDALHLCTMDAKLLSKKGSALFHGSSATSFSRSEIADVDVTEDDAIVEGDIFSSALLDTIERHAAAIRDRK